MAISVDDNCVTLGSNNVTFCKVTERWVPRISKAGAVIARLQPMLFCAIVYGIGMWYTFKKFRICYKIYTDHINFVPKFEVSVFGKTICTLPYKCLQKLSFVFSWYIVFVYKVVYDTLDVGFDSYYFYKLEIADDSLLSSRIMRNKHVNNAILGFVCLGALKSLLIVRVIYWSTDYLGFVKMLTKTTDTGPAQDSTHISLTVEGNDVPANSEHTDTTVPLTVDITR